MYVLILVLVWHCCVAHLLLLLIKLWELRAVELLVELQIVIVVRITAEMMTIQRTDGKIHPIQKIENVARGQNFKISILFLNLSINHSIGLTHR